VSARDDYPHHGYVTWRAMCDEIDRLRLSIAWTERIAQDRGDENERLRVASKCAYCGRFFGQHTHEQWRLCELDAIAALRSRCSDSAAGQDVAS
jgi:hypothetical protein